MAKQYPNAPEMVIDPAKTYTATIETSAGTMTAEFFAADAPKTVNNFVFLARDGYYEDVIFHRCIKGFMTTLRKIILRQFVSFLQQLDLQITSCLLMG